MKDIFDVLVQIGMQEGLIGFTYEVWTYAAESKEDALLQAKVKAEFMTDNSLLLEYRVSEVGNSGQFDKLMKDINGQ